MAIKKKKTVAKPAKKASVKAAKKHPIKPIAKSVSKKTPPKGKHVIVAKPTKKEKSPVVANPVIKASTKSKALSKRIFEIEYPVKISPKLLYNFLSTPSGLSEWFADDVNIKDDVFFFIWEGNVEKAKLLIKRENLLVRFRWMDDQVDYYFEFKIVIDDLTGDVALVITDFAEEKDLKAAMLLWDTQINTLLHNLGS